MEGRGLDTWRRALAEWAIPEEILARAPEPPWTLPAELFARRADAQLEERHSLSLARAEESLRPSGTLLDIGAGAGAASLPLAGCATRLVAVDNDPAMLDQLRPRAGRLGIELLAIEGTWPEVADRTPVCDVTVCSNVLYNVPDLAPFVRSMTERTRRRVVVEITANHPASSISPLWKRFHGIERPDRPTWEDAVRALAEVGVSPRVEHEPQAGGRTLAGSFPEYVAWTRRRLCLSPDRDPEVGQALTELGAEPGRPDSWIARPNGAVILWWDITGAAWRADPAQRIETG